MSRELDAVIKALSKLQQFDLYDNTSPRPNFPERAFFLSLSLSSSAFHCFFKKRAGSFS